MPEINMLCKHVMLKINNPHQKYISIRGAREHNLKNIDLDLPRDKLIVITGLSGSGKSSLAFDTIYAEGQRRYVESLSAYARQFLGIMKKPDVDQIEGLSPTISIEQKTTNYNPRSTVGTITEIYDYMRLLFARIGIPYSPVTGLPIENQTISQMIDKIMALPEGTRIFIMAPFIRGRKGEYKKELAELSKKGFQRAKVDGKFYEIPDIPPLDKQYKHDIDVVIDRVVVCDDIAARLVDSIETCLQLGDGLAIVEMPDQPLEYGKTTKKSAYKSKNETHKRILFSERFSCPVSGFSIPEIEPRLFSFNSPFGACHTCDGLGIKKTIDPAKIVPNDNLSLESGAIAPYFKLFPQQYRHTLKALGKVFGFELTNKWRELSDEIKSSLLYGSPKTREIPSISRQSRRRHTSTKCFEGIIPNIERQWKETDSAWLREEIERYMSSSPCPSCDGYRLKPEALSIKIHGMHIGQISQLSILDADNWFSNLHQHISKKHHDIAEPILKEICERLTFLNRIGLKYLTLSRNSGTLSGGESQRIRLASQIGSGLTGVIYVLDEPSIGLHQRDNQRLLEMLHRLRDLGNTVIVVEHDEDAILTSDHIIDIGPAAGIHGGKIVAQGTAQDLINNESSLTGQYLSGKMTVSSRTQRRKILKSKMLKVIGARGNNLKNISVDIPLGTFTCVTGVSGSGKSTFLIETLFKAVSHNIMGRHEDPAQYTKIEGLEFLDKVININQSPIGRTPRSNPATYTGTFTLIRDWFTELPESRARGYQAGRFSFNVKGGRCEACQGDGVIKIEMHFLPDVYVTCDVCQGKRYNRETLEVKFKEHSIADVLDMTVGTAKDFFQAVPNIHRKMQTLSTVGLSYIKVGQSATTLSGGEAQRIKLAKELSRKTTGRTLYILDEPTTGLHFHDISKLLDVLHKLVDQGNTVIVIEHNLDVVKTADWIIDLGPEGGNDGGEIVAAGRPEDIIKAPNSYTGKFLKKYFLR